MNKGEVNVDPIEGEFFSTEALGSLPDALIMLGDVAPIFPLREQ